ncbi:MAG TPA: PAS domain S-box protein, partial [Gallionella sp.]|nr:PAS domain S-box protein [Gallionella sp.]
MQHHPPESRPDTVQVEQTRLLYARLPMAITFNVLLALFLAYSLIDVIDRSRILAWLGILGAALLFRTALTVAWRRSGAAAGECPPYWIKSFQVGTTATGLAWGIGAALLFPVNDLLHQVLLSFVLAGLSAGAITSLAVDRISTFGFLIPILLPLTGLFIIEGSAHTTAMGIMTALFLVFIASNAVYAGRSQLENFRLRLKAIEQEQVLRQSEARLNRAQHSAHVGNWELDLVNNKLHWSDEIFRIFELDQAEFEPSYEAFLNAVHPDDRDRVNQAYTDSLTSRTPPDIVHRLQFPGGRIKYVREHYETEFNSDDKPIRSIGTVQDITQQQLAENILRESQARYRALTYSASDAIVTADRTEKIVGWNRGAEAIFGYTEAEVIGQHVTMLMPPRYRAQHLAAVARVLAGAQPRISGTGPIELAGVRKDGSEFPLEMSLAQWESGTDKFFTGIIRDISERKKDELALKESEARFRFMLENSPIAACITRIATGEVVFANQSYATLVGSTLDKVIGINPEQYYPSRQDYAEVIAQLQKGRRVTNKLVELLV